MINQINVGVIGTGWCGGIRANACHDNPLVNKLFLAETNTKRLNELKNSLDIEGATENWKELINNDEIDTIIINFFNGDLIDKANKCRCNWHWLVRWHKS